MEISQVECLGGCERITEPITDSELAEYRKLKPRLLRMLEEWEKIRTGCPIAQNIIGDD